VTESPFGPVVFTNGVRWNPSAQPSDEPWMQVRNAVLDVMIAVRGAIPNMNLGLADEFFWAGEWGLALGELDAVLKQESGQLPNGLADLMLERAHQIIALHRAKAT
jgi:hypothetical protein